VLLAGLCRCSDALLELLCGLAATGDIHALAVAAAEGVEEHDAGNGVVQQLDIIQRAACRTRRGTEYSGLSAQRHHTSNQTAGQLVGKATQPTQ